MKSDLKAIDQAMQVDPIPLSLCARHTCERELRTHPRFRVPTGAQKLSLAPESDAQLPGNWYKIRAEGRIRTRRRFQSDQ
jgi:hypothetical protein